jgi:hypothetical protein
MPKEVMDIANSWQIWVFCAFVVLLVVIQNVLYLRLCRKEAVRIGYSLTNINRAVGNGMVTAIGPAFAGVVVMISMMSLVGNPMTWYRLSIIGAAQTELTVANLGVSALGVQLGTAGFSIMALTYVAFLFAYNGNGWLFFTALLTGSMDKVRMKFAGGDIVWLNMFSAGCTLGVFAYLTVAQMLTVVPIGGRPSNPGPVTAVVTAFLAQYIIDRWISPKVKWIKSYAITIALICGIIVAFLVHPV